MGISSGLVTKRARCAFLCAIPESQVSTAASPTYASFSLVEVVNTLAT